MSRSKWETVEQYISRLHSDFYRWLDREPISFRFEEKRYIVTASSSTGAHRPEDGDTIVVRYEGDDYEYAVDLCNRIDQKRDTWFEKVNLPMDAISYGERKFDALIDHILAGRLG